MITSLAIFNNDNYVPERWHTSLIMIATMIVPFVANLWFRKLIDSLEIFGGILHFVLFIVFLVTLIAMGPRSSPDFVFKTLVTDVSGWTNPGVSWCLGLTTATFSVVGMDSVLHMSMFSASVLLLYMLTQLGEEVKKVHTRVPRSIIVACTVNAGMLIVFVLVLLFYMGPLTEELSTAPLPLIYVLYGATGSKAATNALVALLALTFFVCLFNVFASVSRLIWVFARDNGVPFSKTFAYVSRNP